MFTYSEKHVKKQGSILAFKMVEAAGIFSFILFIVFFTLPRLYLFGGVVYSSIYEEEWLRCVSLDCSEESPFALVAAIQVFVLCLLYPMHVHWSILIFKMAYKVVFGVYGDVRSDDEGDSEHEKEE